MTVETFIAKFELLSNAPAAVEKIRELVLGLAVQGKLGTGSRRDEHADRLIEKAIGYAHTLPDAAKQKKLISEWESRAGDITEQLPQGWTWTCNAVIGDTSPRVESDDGAIVAFAPMNLLPTDYRTPFVAETRRWGEIKKGYTHFAEGDVAIAKITPCFQNGKGCVFSKLPGGLGAGTTELHVLRPYPGVVLPLYALLWFKSPRFVEGGVASFTGTAGQQRVANDYFRFTPFPLPPLAEQKRIVAKVDELMALCDRLEAQQKEREAKHALLARAALARFAEAPTTSSLEYVFHNAYDIEPDNLRKAILAAAVRGILVPQNAKDEPALAIVTAIAKDFAETIAKRKMRKTRALEAPDAALLFELPDRWQWSQLGYITAAEDNALCDGPFGSKLKTEHYISEAGYAVLRLGNIGEGHFIKGKEGHISRQHFISLESNHVLRGDLLVAGLADPLIRCCEVPPDIGPAVNKSDCFRFRVHPAIDRSYVRHYLNSPVAKVYAAEENHGMTRERINLASTKALPIPIPPLAEQRRIVAKVDQLVALVDRLEAQLAESRAVGERLMEAVVAELTAAERASESAPPAPAVEMKPDPRVADAGRLACYIVDRMHETTSFGRTKLEKCIDFAQKHCGAPVDRHDIRGRHGPVDYDLLRKAEVWADEAKGFATGDPGHHDKVTYTPGAAMPTLVKEAETWLGDCKPEVDRMLDLLAPLSTFECGLRATVYTAWRDLLAKGKQPNDRDIIRDARHNWHDSKKAITDKQWFKAIRWLEHHDVIPKPPGEHGALFD